MNKTEKGNNKKSFCVIEKNVTFWGRPLSDGFWLNVAETKDAYRCFLTNEHTDDVLFVENLEKNSSITKSFNHFEAKVEKDRLKQKFKKLYNL